MPDFYISHISNIWGLHKDEIKEFMVQASEEYLQDGFLKHAVFPRNDTKKIKAMRMAGVSAAGASRAHKNDGKRKRIEVIYNEDGSVSESRKKGKKVAGTSDSAAGGQARPPSCVQDARPKPLPSSS